ncbi:hypothetical protein VOLCADRAFT_96991 [Volvox carteri f. nagariensis]|uniref:Uncharacterized protein n=1 Tax=Volvox carteri f. nagariensis TaxID=3068 RepID=D8UBL3_VOLCA|nr:uncharacterized protein VOLCADRAFT_96991 [Volvox carteri f. nagariensis]EFJ42842.1 hypothetical protein VOLCADRAFT_96991 [Volvox carteri f. nagariensis]|eukprot:XP_002956102.1 hypothetical protein VOLCADRAFT_96991 [Volvox carteri f. nagariensis]
MLLKATSQQSAFQTVALCPHGRARVPSNQPRRVIINAFLFNPLLKGSSSNGSSGGASRSRETIASRLSELRSPPDDDDRAAFSQRPSRESEDDSNAEDEPSGTGASHEEAGAGLRVRIQMGPWPAETSDDGDGADPAQGTAGARGRYQRR